MPLPSIANTLRLIRERELSAVDIEILIYIKQNPECTGAEIKDALELSRSQLSRHILFLSAEKSAKDKLKKGSEGKRLNTPKEMPFISRKQNDKNIQRPLLSLTQRGSNVISDLLNSLSKAN